MHEQYCTPDHHLWLLIPDRSENFDYRGFSNDHTKEDLCILAFKVKITTRLLRHIAEFSGHLRVLEAWIRRFAQSNRIIGRQEMRSRWADCLVKLRDLQLCENSVVADRLLIVGNVYQCSRRLLPSRLNHKRF